MTSQERRYGLGATVEVGDGELGVGGLLQQEQHHVVGAEKTTGPYSRMKNKVRKLQRTPGNPPLSPFFKGGYFNLLPLLKGGWEGF